MSTLKADTIQSTGGGAATLTKQSAAKAWLYFKQNTPEVTDSFNTSSATDSSTGNFLQNYVSSFDASYDGRALSGTGFATDKFLSHGSTGSTTSAQQYNLYDISGSGLDDSFSSAVTHGDLA